MSSAAPSTRRSAEVKLFDAQDAHSSATMLALLSLAAVTLFAIAQRRPGLPWPVAMVGGGVGLLAAAALALLWTTRRAPREDWALAICVLHVAAFVVLVALLGLHWQRVGRPWEAFGTLQLAVAGVALVVTRPLLLPVGALVVLAAETVLLFARFDGAPETRPLVPLGEPWTSLMFVGATAAVLSLRHRRRRDVLGYVQRAGAAAAMRAATGQLSAVRDVIRGSSAELERLLASLPARGADIDERLRRSLARVERAGAGLTHEPHDTPPPAPSARLEEERLFADEAHRGAVACAALVVVLQLFVHLAMRDPALRPAAHVWFWVGGLAAAELVLLFAVRHRPSERLATALFALLIAAAMVGTTVGQHRWVQTGRVFEPLAGAKMMAMILPLMLPRRAWIGYAIELVIALFAIGLYFAFRRGWGDWVSLADPWLTSLYVVIGIGLLLTREQRRVTSLRLLRADRELAGLVQETRTSLRALDALGSPLQILTLQLELWQATAPDDATLRAMRQAVVRINEALARLPAPDPQIFSYLGAALDDAPR